MASPSIALLSETIIGYGSPQVPVFATALGRHFNTRPTIWAPFDETPPRRDLYPEIDVDIVPVSRKTKRYWPIGRAEYCWRVAEKLNKHRPDVVVAMCTYTLPALRRLNYRPKRVIYYALESLSNYPQSEVYINRKVNHLFDMVIYPEFNRAAMDGSRALTIDKPLAIMHNNVHSEKTLEDTLPADGRNGRIVHPGSIAYEVTYAGYFLDPRSAAQPLDIYGILYGDKLKQAVKRLSGNVRYLGVVDERTLAGLRRDYSWGIVTWNPETENGRYAAPNKLFDYLSSAVPAIVAPHPQAAEIVREYGCGLVMPDWSYESFYSTIQEALLIGQSPHYAKYVEGCKRAHRDLCWERQFEKFLTVFNQTGGLA